MTIYVTLSDHPLPVPDSTVALAGQTDDKTSLEDLLVLMYRTWMEPSFQEGVHAERSRIVVPH